MRDPAAPQTSYERWTRQPLIYFPVLLRGELLGYLWASKEHNAASFLRRMWPNRYADPFDDPSLACSFYWQERLTDAHGRGLRPVDALREWVGATEDPVGGAIPGDAREETAPSTAELRRRVNPEDPRLNEEPLIQDGEFADGTPVDRAQGWGPLVSAPLPRYPTEADSAVRFFAVTKDDTIIGYLWAATTGAAADYLPRVAAGRTGWTAAGHWRLGLSRAYEAGLSAVDALQRCRHAPETPLSGTIADDAAAQELPSLAHLRALAGQP
ncbi:hypothetical protein [Nocardia sp. NPDC049149]|uniref:hypothetical protein n=1 Tax=Nocardia sp. NPDC049149 TaxID=3364315 RepID=UPI00371B3715